MSDEEVIIGDDDAYAEQDDDAYGDGTPEIDGDVDASTPLGRYQSAKDYIGFDDMNAVCLFYEVYNDEEAEVPLRMRALRKAAVVLSQHDDIEQILQALELLFACYECQWLDGDKCQDTIREMLANVVRSEEVLTQFLDKATERVDKNNQVNLYLDLKLRQCELMLKYADYEKAGEFMREAEEFCPLPPDPNDRGMCRAAIRLLILKIEFADFENNEEAMFAYYKQASAIPKQTLSPRQSAVLLQIEGLQAFNNRQFSVARSKFFDAFQTFNELGSDKRVKCLPYVSLAAMLVHESVSIFMAPEVRHFLNHPAVAPLAQLNDAYRASDVVLFTQRIPSAQLIFNSSPYYNGLIDEVRQYVLLGAVKNFCRAFSRVELQYVAEKLETAEKEIVSVVHKLIVAGELEALVDPAAKLIIMQKSYATSRYIANIDNLLDGIELLVTKAEKRLAKKLRA